MPFIIIIIIITESTQLRRPYFRFLLYPVQVLALTHLLGLYEGMAELHHILPHNMIPSWIPAQLRPQPLFSQLVKYHTSN